jgi:hypothetical protein
MMRIYNIDSQDAANAEQTIRNVYDVSGKGITVLVADDGNVLETHQEFKDSTGTYTRVRNLLPLAQSPYEEHATHVAGTIGARGVYPNAKGFAPDCSLVTYEMNTLGIENQSANYKNIVNSKNVNVSNHSYGKVIGEYHTGKIVGTSSSVEGEYSITVIKYWLNFINSQGTAQLNEYLEMGKYTVRTSNIDYILYDVSNSLSVWAAGNERSDNFISLNTFNVSNSAGTPTTTISFEGKNITIAKNSGATLTNPICILSSDYSEAFLYGTAIDVNSGFRYFIPDSDLVGGNGTTKYYLPDGNTSNGGYDSITPYSVAKNSLVVGSVGRPDSNAINDDPRSITLGMTTLSLFSSTGPTDDGRIKPDLVADGSGVLSTVNVSSNANIINAYISYSGTSMAAPAVTGSAALVHEYYRKTIGNQSYRMPSATLKAILLANAYRGNAPPNYATGYGIVDVSKSLGFLQKWNNDNVANSNYVYLNELSHAGGSTENTYSIYPKATDISVNILICWNDYQPSTYNVTDGTVVDASHSVITNKLVIECQDSITQTKYYPWYLNVNNPAETARNAVATGQKDTVWDISAAHDNTKLIEFTPKNTNAHTISVKMYNNAAVQSSSSSVGQKYTLLVENASMGTATTYYFRQISTGSYTNPRYGFYADSTYGTEITLTLIKGQNYKFVYRSGDSGHPFEFVASTGLTISPASINPGGEITLQIASSYGDSTIDYRCVSHPSDPNMNGTFTVDELIISSAPILSSGSAVGDPYIYPYFGTQSGLPIKLPDLDAYYTMYQSADVSIYAHVKQATCEHKQRMIEYVEMLKATNCVSPNILVTSVETDGFFFREVYVVVKGEPLYIDLHEEREQAKRTEKREKIYRTRQFCEPCQYMQIPLNECLFLNIMFFENPHIENGLELVGDVPANATGILVREEDIQSRCLVSDGPWQYHHPCLV